MSAGREFLSRHTRLFNEGVRSGDFGLMVAQFADDAELIFQGVPMGPFRGKTAIAAAYQARPPTDEIELLRVDDTGPEISAVYAWSSRPSMYAGRMIITQDGKKISRLVIVYDQAGGNGG